MMFSRWTLTAGIGTERVWVIRRFMERIAEDAGGRHGLCG
jgi:hypothetical protein